MSQRAQSTHDQVDDRRASNKEQETDQDGQKGLGVIYIEPLPYTDKSGNQRPDSTDDPTHAGNNSQELGCIGKADHA